MRKSELSKRRPPHVNHFTLNRPHTNNEEVVISDDDEEPIIFIKEEVKKEVEIEDGDIDFLGEVQITSQPARPPPPPPPSLNLDTQDDCVVEAAFIQQEKDKEQEREARRLRRRQRLNEQKKKIGRSSTTNNSAPVVSTSTYLAPPENTNRDITQDELRRRNLDRYVQVEPEVPPPPPPVVANGEPPNNEAEGNIDPGATMMPTFQNLAVTINTPVIMGEEPVTMCLQFGDNTKVLRVTFDKDNNMAFMPPPPPPPPPLQSHSCGSCQTGPSMINGEEVSRNSEDVSTPIRIITPTRVSDSCQTGPSMMNGEEVERVDVDVLRNRSSSPSSHASRRRERRDRNDPRERRESSVASSIAEQFASPQDLNKIIKDCSVCGDHFGTRREAADHKKRDHNKKHCPVCFKLLSCKGNTFKNHLNRNHASEDGEEKAKCPFCSRHFPFEGIYNHIARMHLMQVERDEAEEHAMIRNAARTFISQRKGPPRASNAAPSQTRARAASPASRVSSSNNHSTRSAPSRVVRSSTPSTSTSPAPTRSTRPAAAPETIRISSKIVPTINLNTPPSTSSSSNSSAPSPPPVPAPPRPIRRETCYAPRDPVIIRPTQPPAAPPDGSTYKRSLAASDIGSLGLHFTQNPTPDAKELTRISHSLQVNVDVIKNWFNDKYTKKCRELNKKKKQRTT